MAALAALQTSCGKAPEPPAPAVPPVAEVSAALPEAPGADVSREEELERQLQAERERADNEARARMEAETAREMARLEKEEADLLRQQAEHEAQLARDEVARQAAATVPPVVSVPAVPPPSPELAVGEIKPATDHRLFYESLDPYGVWMDTAAYGFVWQPHVARRDPLWRPYTVGRWAWTDQGWTWVTEEPFGWIVYHYGRWAQLEETGWVWVPGEVWAPAWVSWREADDVVGWAPLPPETIVIQEDYGPWIEERCSIGIESYVFVQVIYFGDRVYDHCYPRHRNRDFWGRCRNVTDFRFRDHRVTVGGPDFRRISGRLPKPLPEWRLLFDRTPPARTNDCFPRLQAGNLRLVAPAVGAPHTKIHPRLIEKQLPSVRVKRGEQPLDPAIAERFNRYRQDRRAISLPPARKPDAESTRIDEALSARRKSMEDLRQRQLQFEKARQDGEVERQRRVRLERERDEVVARQKGSSELHREAQLEKQRTDQAEAQKDALERQRQDQLERQKEALARQREAQLEKQRTDQAEAQKDALERQRQDQLERQKEALARQREAQLEKQRADQAEAQKDALERQRQEQLERQKEALARQREAQLEKQRQDQAERQREQMERQRAAQMERARADQAERQREQLERQREAQMERARADQAERQREAQLEKQRKGQDERKLR